MAADLSARDIEKGKMAFEVYDFDGSGKIDAFYVGDVLRGLNLNPTLELIEKMGGTKKKNEKMLTVEEFLPIYGQVKKEKEMGTYEDFNECMKLYDKVGNNTMLKAELEHILLSLGEKLEKDQVEEIMKECCPPEDEDGFIQFVPYLKKLIAGPFAEEK